MQMAFVRAGDAAGSELRHLHREKSGGRLGAARRRPPAKARNPERPSRPHALRERLRIAVR